MDTLKLGLSGGKKGFTLIELLVMIVVISLLATITFSTVVDIQKNARDAKRKADLKIISTALEAFFVDNEKFKVDGGGYLGDGQGWINYETTPTGTNPYPAATTTKLAEAGYITDGAIDPFVIRDEDEPTGHYYGYMMYYCNDLDKIAVMGRLENPSQKDLDEAQEWIDAGCPAYPITLWNKNYLVLSSATYDRYQ